MAIYITDAAGKRTKVGGIGLPGPDASKLTDDTTGEKYKLGVDNGLLYIQAVEEETNV